MKTVLNCNNQYTCLIEVSLTNILYFRYYADPSGAFFAFKAKAIGSGSEGAQTELQDQYHQVINFKKFMYRIINIYIYSQ